MSSILEFFKTKGFKPEDVFDLPEIVPDFTLGRGREDQFRRMIFRNLNRPRPSKEQQKEFSAEELIAVFLGEDMRKKRMF